MANVAKVTMPQLGESVTEGTIGAWLKKPGDKVEKYESLAEVITDKVNAEIPSPYEGTIREILAPENEPLPVGTVIATIETEAEVEDAAAGHQAPAPAAAAAAPAPAAPQPAPAPAPVAAAPQPTPAPAPAATAAPAQPATPQRTDGRDGGGNGRAAATEGGAGSRRLSPAVARLIEEHNLDPSQIAGSGIEGRITKIDVEKYLEDVRSGKIQPAAAPAPAQPAAAAAAPAQPAAPAYEPVPAAAAPAPAAQPQPAPVFTSGQDQLVPLTQMRRAIADHMVRSVHTSPHAWTLVEVDMNNIWTYRQRIKERFRQREGLDPSLLAFVMIEVMKGIKQHPFINSVWSDQGIVLKHELNAGIPIDLGDQGLIVPVVHRADEKSFVGLTRAIHDLADRARAGKLRIEELQGGTFTLNNSGTFGSIQSMPILSQPNVINLTMEAIVKRPVVIDDMIAIRPIMNMCCSFDHRVLDGATVGRFLQTVKKNIESFNGESLGL